MIDIMKKPASYMLKMVLAISLFHLFTLSLTACGGGDDDDSDGNTKPDYIAANEEMDMPDANVVALSIKANCKWMLYVDAEWLTVDPATGENNAKVTLTASPNKTGEERTCTIFMRNETNTLERTVVVSQKPAPNNSFVPLPGENPLPE